MFTKEKLQKIMNPIQMNEHINEENISGKWGEVKWFFHIYRNRYFKKGVNLISLNFFMMENIDEVYSAQKGKTLENHKKNHIEKIKKYTIGLDKIIRNNKKINLYTTVRIYCDVTSAHLVEKYLRNKYVEIYVYFFPDFFDSNNLIHYGFFGTLVRYLPLFKLEKHNEGEWNTTTILDIDIKYFDEPILMKYFMNKKQTPNIMFRNRACYYMIPRLKYMNLELPYFSVISNFIIQKQPQKLEIFTDFLNNCLLKSCPQYDKLLVQYFDFKSNKKINLSKRPLQGKLEYGVDEYFINAYFIKKCYFDNNKEILEVFVRDNRFQFYEWISYLKNEKIKNPELLEKFLLVLMKISVDKTITGYKNIGELIEKINNYLYFGNKEHFKKEYSDSYFKQIYDIISKIGPDKLNMPDNILLCLKRYTNKVNDKLVVRIVKPNPKYPEFKEDIFSIIR